MGTVHWILRKKEVDDEDPCRCSNCCKHAGWLSSKLKMLGISSNSSRNVLQTCSLVGSSFQTLPEEILLGIFKFLETTDLLETCRLVSRQWKRVSTEMCRNRHVCINLEGLAEEMDQVDIPSFFDMADLPWSSVSFMFHSTTSEEVKRKFIHDCGNHLWEFGMPFEIESAQDVIALLQNMPNLRFLTLLDFSRQEHGPWISEPSGGVNLRHLTHLRIDNMVDDEREEGHAIDVLEFLEFVVLTGGARLEDVDVGFGLCIENLAYAEVVLSLLPNLRSISFMIDPNSPVFDYFMEELNSVNIPGVCLKLCDVPETDGGSSDFGPSETFLSARSGQLEKLSLKVCVRTGLSPRPFKFPSLPRLGSLSVDFGNDGILCQDFTNSFLRLLDVDLFPVLREVRLTGSGDWTEDENNLFFPPTFSCQTVTHLTVHLFYPVLDDWSGVFPNLTSLTWDLVFSEDEALLQIFGLKKLEHLKLQLEPVHDFDPDQLFSGIPNPEALCMYQASNEEIAEERLARGLPSILDLTELKTLKLDFDPIGTGQKRLTNAGAYLSLLLLQPLFDLWLWHASISEECQARLRIRHKKFQMDNFKQDF